MKRYTPWLLGLLLLVAGFGCDDEDSSRYDRTTEDVLRT